MIDALKGKTILIGKEPGQGRLLIAIKGAPKVTTLGQIGSVPNSVSRCKPAEGVAHCQIEIDQTGNMTLTNMKAQNVTYVNGFEIMSKRIDSTSTIMLGKDRFGVNVMEILNAAQQILIAIGGSRSGNNGPGNVGGAGGAGIQPGGPYSIKHLKDVWDDYSASLKKIKIRQKHIGLLSSIPIAFTMLGTIIIGVAPEIRPFAIVFTGIALIVMLIGLYLRFTDKSIEETEKLNEKFQDRYVCPNPKCHHFLGNQSYKILRQNKICSYCKCQLTEE